MFVFSKDVGKLEYSHAGWNTSYHVLFFFFKVRGTDFKTTYGKKK
jgi:hypothetical protein